MSKAFVGGLFQCITPFNSNKDTTSSPSTGLVWRGQVIGHGTGLPPGDVGNIPVADSLDVDDRIIVDAITENRGDHNYDLIEFHMADEAPPTKGEGQSFFIYAMNFDIHFKAA